MLVTICAVSRRIYQLKMYHSCLIGNEQLMLATLFIVITIGSRYNTSVN